MLPTTISSNTLNNLTAVKEDTAGQTTAQALPRFDSILLCTDFSPSSRRAADVALRLAQRCKARVTALHVNECNAVPEVTLEGIDFEIERSRTQRDSLRETIQSLHEAGVDAQPSTRAGLASEAILEEIRTASPSLVVIGTNAERGFDRFVFGSTAEAVFRSSSCPVITVGPAARNFDEIAGGPVVFATNFHESEAGAMRTAAALAAAGKVPLHLIDVLPPSENNPENPIVSVIIDQALRHLASGATAHVETHVKVIYGRDISEAVVEYAKTQGAQTIALGVQRTSRLASHLPPHYSYRIIMSATCPVLTVDYGEKNALDVAAECP